MVINIVAHEPRGCGGVLIRAFEPIMGIEIMKRLRGIEDLFKQTNGPGKLTEALAIDKILHKAPVCQEGSEVTIRRGRKERNIARSFRVGVTKDLDVQLRFYIDSRFLSARG